MRGRCPPRVQVREIERAALGALLCKEHDERWECEELCAALAGAEPWALARAIERLHHEGAVEIGGPHIRASRCARHLHELGVLEV